MKITFLGAGSTIFVKSTLGDLFLTDTIPGKFTIALYDIDGRRLEESRMLIQALNERYNRGEAVIETYLGMENRREALHSTDFVINAVQIGGYEPATVADFEIPRKYGLKQTIGDTLGIGGIFRGLRTIPFMLDMAEDLAASAPGAWFLNYTNPMSIVTGALIKDTAVKTVGLCHSVQGCAAHLLRDLEIPVKDLRWHIAGINHMAWLLEVKDGGEDLYPVIKEKAAALVAAGRKDPEKRVRDMVRYDLMRLFGYYITESSEHNAEYSPFWIKNCAPELIEEYGIPLDEYPRRCIKQIAEWEEKKQSLLKGDSLEHTRSNEYAAGIVSAVINDTPYRIHGNVANNEFIPNLPREAIVEVPCLVDGNGIQGCYVGALPEQCAAMNRTNINVHLLTLQAARERSREAVYRAALLDPHTAAELPPDQIIQMCDELLEAHREWLPEYK